jgi:hypothetical protein
VPAAAFGPGFLVDHMRHAAEDTPTGLILSSAGAMCKK